MWKDVSRVSKIQTYRDRTGLFVISGLGKSLLRHPTIEALAIVTLVELVTLQSNDTIQQFPKVYTGLGRLIDHYTIKLQSDCQPHA